MKDKPRLPPMPPTLVVLAAGLGSRYGGLKQLDAVGPRGQALFDYGVYDAVRAGFSRVVLVIQPELEGTFRDHVAQTIGESVEVSFAHQRLTQLPPGFPLPPGRTRPWGTGHALLAAEPLVSAPFAVSNADDFYGATSYALLHDHLEGVGASAGPVFAMVGYALRETLSPYGGVSRGICECDEDGFLAGLTEVQDIKQEAEVLSGVSEAGRRLEFTGGEMTAMSLWGFTPVVFPLLRREFARFLEKFGGTPNTEFLATTALNELIRAGDMRLKVMRASDRWLGVTFPEDRQHVAAELERLVREGVYPYDLAAALAGK